MDDIGEIFGLILFICLIGIIISLGEAFGWVNFALIVAGCVGYGVWRKADEPNRDRRKFRKETKLLQKRVKELNPSAKQVAQKLMDAGLADDDMVFDIACDLLISEGYDPGDEPDDLLSIDHARYRDKLKKLIELVRTENRLDTVIDDMLLLLHPFRWVDDGVFLTSEPLTAEDVQSVIADIYTMNEEHGTFAATKRIIDKNIARENCLPTKYKGDENVVYAFLRGTPLSRIRFYSGAVNLENRTRHTMILGGSGMGKTVMMKYLIYCDIADMVDDEVEQKPHIVVIDSQRQLIPELEKIPFPDDDVTYLNPEWDLGINLFDVGWEKLKTEEAKEEAMNQTVGLIVFMLQGALTTKITDRQELVLRYASQLVITIPGGNFWTLYDILEEDGIEPYQDYIANLSERGQNFFNKEWKLPVYKQTREAVRSRLHILTESRTFERLFSATENRFDMFEEIGKRRLILLDTHKPALQEGSSVLGRLYIAMLVRASQRRWENEGKHFEPVYVYVDEAHEYFDQSIKDMFEQARKANIGITIAHQDLDQIKDNPLLNVSTVLGCTATKLVATSIPGDAAEVAKSMRVRADDILDLPDYTFGIYNRSYGYKAVRAPEDPLDGLLESNRKGVLKNVMEERYGIKKKPSPRPGNGGASPSPSDGGGGTPSGSSGVNVETDLPDVELI